MDLCQISSVHAGRNNEDSFHKNYQIKFDGKPVDIFYCLKSEEGGRVSAYVDISWDDNRWSYKNGQSLNEGSIENEGLLEALDFGLGKDVKRYIPELQKPLVISRKWNLVDRINSDDGTYREVYARMIGQTKFTVEYSLKEEAIDDKDKTLVPWVAISNGHVAKVYRNGERLSSGILEIENQQVIEALKELPRNIAMKIPELKMPELSRR